MIHLGNITIREVEKGQWEATALVTGSGMYAVDALFSLLSRYPLFGQEVIAHFDEFREQFGPFTDTQLVELLHRIASE